MFAVEDGRGGGSVLHIGTLAGSADVEGCVTAAAVAHAGDCGREGEGQAVSASGVEATGGRARVGGEAQGVGATGGLLLNMR